MAEDKFKKNLKKKNNCNCICCKFCNENWTEFKPSNEKFQNKKIKFRKKYYCNFNCYNCMKYINKKKKQWEIYISTNNVEINQNTKQPEIGNLQINVLKDTKSDIKNKIKNLGEEDFSIIETKKDGNCMFTAILKSIKENVSRHLELRQIAADFVEEQEYEEEEAIFKEEGNRTKKENAIKIRKDGEYTNDIVLEAISKKTNITFAIYKDDERYRDNPWTIIEPNQEQKYKGIIMLLLVKEKTQKELDIIVD